MTKVKICGLSRPEDIEAVNAYGADYAGIVFFEKSKRNVSYEKAEMLIEEKSEDPVSCGVRQPIPRRSRKIQ